LERFVVVHKKIFGVMPRFLAFLFDLSEVPFFRSIDFDHLSQVVFYFWNRYRVCTIQIDFFDLRRVMAKKAVFVINRGARYQTQHYSFGFLFIVDVTKQPVVQVKTGSLIA
jgi:hypothetical protein